MSYQFIYFCFPFSPTGRTWWGRSLWLGSLSRCAPIKVVEIGTDTCDNHEEANVLHISVRLEYHRETVTIEIRVVFLNCCKIATSPFKARQVVGCAIDT